MKSKDLHNSIATELREVYPEMEAKNIASILLEELYGISQTDLVLNNLIQSYNRKKIEEVISRLKRNEPIQYVLGKAHFYGRDFKVNPNVLIPRKETEELVDHIIKDHPSFNGRILDIGTGSGCIPITMSIELTDATVEAVDISQDALETARENAKLLNANIVFHQLDTLSKEHLPSTYDIIVSNPPYVMAREKKLIQANVLNHEPHLALFVEDGDPLAFYNAIISKATRSLNPKGMLYFEINEQFGNEVSEVMENAGFRNIKIIKDMQGKDRIVKGFLN